jgi:hypothetical protein
MSIAKAATKTLKAPDSVKPAPELPTFGEWLNRFHPVSGTNLVQMVSTPNMIELPWGENYYGETLKLHLTSTSFNGCSSISINGMGDFCEVLRNSLLAPKKPLPFTFTAWMDVLNLIIKHVFPMRFIGTPAFFQTAPQSVAMREWIKTIPHEIACEFYNPNYSSRPGDDERTTLFVLDLYALQGRKSNYQGLCK